MVRVALTGSPGVGKTTLAAAAAATGWQVVDVHDFARLHGAVAGFDDEHDAAIVDVDALRAHVPPPVGHDVLFDGHLSHQLGLDVTWVLRCHPDELARRLRARAYAAAKVQENVEAEAMDLILQEALAAGAPVVQRDATRRAPPELLASFTAATRAVAAATRAARAARRGAPDRSGRGAPTHDIEPVDWSDWLLEADHGA
jgi:adenylate kinase